MIILVEKLTLQTIKKAVNGKCNYDCEIKSISIDTRKLTEGCLFIAIKGENFDGHNFVEQALKGGAAAAISANPFPLHENVIIVEDTKKALLDLAKYYKSLFNVFTVGVTGSVGKTSTKEMIYTILSVNGNTLKTYGNHNNEIGMPLTLFNLTNNTKNAVLEMGMSNFNEISVLSKICMPNVGVITNIGVSHIETLKSRENILKAKLEIIDGMCDDSPLILNGDDDMLITVSTLLDKPIIYYGIDNQTADVTAFDIKQDGSNTEFSINYFGKIIKAIIPTIGRHNVMNALAGFCVGIVADIAPEQIVGAMKWYKNASMRQNTIDIQGVTIIEDCYNASPASMRAAIDVITAMECTGKRVCVFGDMLELGSISDDAHIEVGKEVGRSRVDLLLCYGNQGKLIKKGAIIVGMKNVLHFDDATALAQYLAGNIVGNDAVIFKASRGVKLESVIDLYKELMNPSK